MIEAQPKAIDAVINKMNISCTIYLEKMISLQKSFIHIGINKYTFIFV